MNIIQVAGHLGADPEVRYAPDGTKITTFRIATNQRKSGKEETVWWRVTIWGDRFDKMIAHLKKGSSVIVVGELSRPEIYTDREGRPQVSLDIRAEFIRFSPFGRPGQESPQTQTAAAMSSGTAPYGGATMSFESKEPNLASSTSWGQGSPRQPAAAYGEQDNDVPF